MSDPQHDDMLAAWGEPRHGANQCQHGQLARVCVICEQAVEIERLITTLNHAREYHAKELADVTAERDHAQQQVAGLRAEYESACKLVADMHAAAMGAKVGPALGVIEDVAQLRIDAERLRAQVAAFEVDIAAEKLFSTQAMQAAQYMAEERDEAREQVAIYAAERDEARTAWSNRTKELERMEAERDGLREEAINLRAQRDAVRADAHTLREQAAGLEADAGRYRWLRAGNYTFAVARSILNDTPHGIDAFIDRQLAARGGEHA